MFKHKKTPHARMVTIEPMMVKGTMHKCLSTKLCLNVEKCGIISNV